MTVQNKRLTDYFAGHVGEQADFPFLERIAPLVGVDRRAFEYEEFGPGGFREEDDSAGEHSPANTARLESSTKTDRVPQRKLAAEFTETEINEHESQGTLNKRRQAKTRRVANSLLVKQASRLVTLMEDTAQVTNTAATAAWGGAGDDPIADVDAISQSVFTQSGRRPNKLIFPGDLFSTFIRTSEVQAQFNSWTVITPEMVTSLFSHKGIQETWVVDFVKDSNAEGQAESPANAFANTKMWAAWIPNDTAEMDPTDRSPFKTFFYRPEWNRVDTSRNDNPVMETNIHYRSYLQKLTDATTVHMLTGA